MSDQYRWRHLTIENKVMFVVRVACLLVIGMPDGHLWLLKGFLAMLLAGTWRGISDV